jgi:hypothetical protein
VVAVPVEHEQSFLSEMKGHPTTVLGTVDDTPHLTILDGDETLVETDVETMASLWKGTLDLTGGVM